MNIQNLLNQLGTSKNPMTFLTSMLNPNQKQVANLFQGKNKEEQAELIAQKANELGLTKEQFQELWNMLNGKK